MRASWFLLLSLATAGCSSSSTPNTTSGPPVTEMHVAGLAAPADVSVDGFGVLHVSCKTDSDCIFLQGYFHSQYRFFEMDFFRRVARSRLATLLGLLGDAVGTDESLRPLLSTRQGDPIAETIWADMQTNDKPTADLLQDYSNGVNAWLADAKAGRNGATLTGEYQTLGVTAADIPDWDPVDSVAFARLQTLSLGYTGANDLALGAAMDKLKPDLNAFLDVFNQLPCVNVFTFQAAGATYRPIPTPLRAEIPLSAWDPVVARLDGLGDTLADAAARMQRALAILAPLREPAGSNNWVVAPTHTKAHHAMLANDPHLDLMNPSIWTMVELDSKTNGTGTLHVAGGSFPGAPGVEIGRNENLAWGATVAEYDTADAYIETVATDQKGVMFGGAEVPFIDKTVSFDVRGGSPQTKAYQWVPQHGPVMATAPDGRPITVRWTGFESTDEIKAFLGLARAGTVAEGMTALKDFRVGAQNFVLADTHGDIGWDPHADVPARPWANGTDLAPWLPLPGDGTAEWVGTIPDVNLPHLSTADATSGFIATANNDMTGATLDGDPTNDGYLMLQSYPAVSYRLGRIVQLLQARTDHDKDSLLAIQGDVHSLVADTLLPALLTAASGATLTPKAQDVLMALSTWKNTCPTGLTGDSPDSPASTDPKVVAESAGCTAFHATLDALYAVVLGDVYTAAGLNVTSGQNDELIRPITYLLINPSALRDPDALWDDTSTPGTETEAEDVAKALDMAGTALESNPKLGPSATQWLWGRVHTLTMDFQGLPGTSTDAFAAPGGLFTVNVANPPPDPKVFTFTSGPSLRIINDASPSGITTFFQLPGGQDEHADSPHHLDLLPRWLHNQPFQFPFTRQEADAAAKSKLHIVP